jgi:hypothetical protein
MGTRTDFYVGTGTDAEWIGSLQFGCHPYALLKDWYGHAALTARTHTAYRKAVDQLLFTWAVNGLGAAHQPRHGWPWTWNTSHCNDWIVTATDRIDDPADGGTHADPNANTGKTKDPATGKAAGHGIYLTAGGGSAWHHLDPDNPRPPLRCGPSNFAHWLTNPAAPPAVALPMHDAAPPSTDAVYHWWG